MAVFFASESRVVEHESLIRQMRVTGTLDENLRQQKMALSLVCLRGQESATNKRLNSTLSPFEPD